MYILEDSWDETGCGIPLNANAGLFGAYLDDIMVIGGGHDADKVRYWVIQLNFFGAYGIHRWP